MPPPATAASLPAFESTLRAIVLPAELMRVKPLARQVERRVEARRSVQGKDFLQRLREAGL